MRILYLLNGETQEFDVDSHYIIVGRMMPGEFVLDLRDDSKVSRRHARIVQENDDYWIEDMDSKNGTLVNGERIYQATRIVPGDEIQIGQTIMEIAPEVVEEIPEQPRIEDDTPTWIGSADDLPEGEVSNTIYVPQSATDLIIRGKKLNEEELETTRRHLDVFYRLTEALGTINDIHQVSQTILEYLYSAVPHVRSAGLLLIDKEKLALKAFLPRDHQPTVSRSLALHAMEHQEAFVWRAGLMHGIDPSASIMASGIECAMYAPLIWKGEALGVIYLDNADIAHAFSDDDLRLTAALSNQAAMFIKNHLLQEQLLEEERVRSNLMRQFSPRVADRLVRQGSRQVLGGERVPPVTILMTDIRGFTAMSATLSPDRLVTMLNEMYGKLIPIIFNYAGTVDKYTGDGVLAVFGSPEPDENQWENAVKAALAMQKAMEELDQPWKVGIGIHSGEVVHGFVGVSERMEYTVIGDTVNRTSRICDGTQGGEVCVSRSVFERIEQRFEIEPEPRFIQTKHPEREPDLEAYIIRGLLRQTDPFDRQLDEVDETSLR